jgi:hypothetical protein
MLSAFPLPSKPATKETRLVSGDHPAALQLIDKIRRIIDAAITAVFKGVVRIFMIISFSAPVPALSSVRCDCDGRQGARIGP